MITLGAFIFALAVNVFVIPSDLGEGGVTGNTIILYYLFGWSPGLMSFILNGFLLIIGYKFLSKQTIRYTIDRKSTRLNSSHVAISYAGFCLKPRKSLQ